MLECLHPEGNFLYSEQRKENSAVSIVNSFTLEKCGYTIRIETQREEDGLIHTLNELSFELNFKRFKFLILFLQLSLMLIRL